jgi:hypothetical protein
VRVVIYAPVEGANALKLQAMRELGADVRLHGRNKLQRPRNVNYLLGKTVFEDRIANSLFNKRWINAKAYSFLVRHCIGFLKTDRFRKAYPLDLGFQRFATDHSRILDVNRG